MCWPRPEASRPRSAARIGVALTDATGRRGCGLDRGRVSPKEARKAARKAARSCRLPHSSQMLAEKVDRQAERAVGLGLAVRPAAMARKGVVGAGILVNRHQGIGRE